jgi:hypothetical protein
VSEQTIAYQPVEIQMDQWAWWCRDSQALQSRNLGLANCLVCAQEPAEVFAWECDPLRCPADHTRRDVAQHVRFKDCGHQIEVIFSWEALDRLHR